MLSDAIEHKDFNQLIHFCKGLFFEEVWRGLGSTVARHHGDRPAAYGLADRDLEEYRMFQITKCFIGILSGVKAKVYFKHLSNEQIEALNTRFEKSLELFKEMQKQDAIESERLTEELKKDEDYIN